MDNGNRQTEIVLTKPLTDDNGNYKETVKKLIYRIIGNTLDEETKEVTAKLNEERQRAIDSLVEENRSAIKGMVEEGKKLIQAKARAAGTFDAFSTEFIDEVITCIYKMDETTGNGKHPEMIKTETPEVNSDAKEWTELEILPPRDQEEIDAIDLYLHRLPQVTAIELLTMVDKSVFKVKTREPVDFIEKLSSLPEVLAVESVKDREREKVRITLTAKSKLTRTQDEMNARVKKIFHGKK